VLQQGLLKLRICKSNMYVKCDARMSIFLGRWKWDSHVPLSDNFTRVVYRRNVISISIYRKLSMRERDEFIKKIKNKLKYKKINNLLILIIYLFKNWFFVKKNSNRWNLSWNLDVAIRSKSSWIKYLSIFFARRKVIGRENLLLLAAFPRRKTVPSTSFLRRDKKNEVQTEFEKRCCSRILTLDYLTSGRLESIIGTLLVQSLLTKMIMRGIRFFVDIRQTAMRMANSPLSNKKKKTT